jgi:hypothetical protein
LHRSSAESRSACRVIPSKISLAVSYLVFGKQSTIESELAYLGCLVGQQFSPRTDDQSLEILRGE